MHDNDGNPSAAWALATANTTSERSPGVITAMPSVSRSNTWSAVIPAASTPITSRSRSATSPLTTAPFTACVNSATVGADSSGSSGTT
ncbi:Uncharacterised protein [Mycobacterium tuberculosis]|nr:Uncharacterised protein [Mycobacterium tuberculosis]